MKRKILSLICVFGFLLPAMAFSDQENARDTQATELEEVVVTAARSEEAVEEVNASVTVLDEQEIRMSPARDLGDLLAEENIGHIQKTPGNLTSLGIRGFRTSATGNDLQGKVLILLNGRRAGTGNLAKIMTRNIERIEIIRGPASVQYGSAAVGGLVNVITKQGRKEPSFFVEGNLGSFGHEEAAAGFSGKVNGFDFSGTVSRSTRDDYDTADDEEYNNTAYDEKENISLNLGYEFLPENRIGVIYTDFDANEIGAPYYLSSNDLDDYSDKSNESLDFIYDGQTRDGLFSWKARYFTGEDESTFVDPVASNPGGIDTGIPTETETDHEGAQAQLTWNPGQYRLTAGVDWINYEIEQAYKPNKTEYDNPSWFLLGKAKYFEDRLILSGGLRYDDYEVEIREGQGRTEDDDNVSPKIGASYFILDNLKIRANYGQGFRMPAARELAGDYSSWGLPYRGNPDLDPEESDTYEIGLDWYHKAFDASLTYFYTDFEDKIETVSTAGGATSWENLGEATVSGFEGKFSYDLAALWNLNWKIKPYVNFTYLTEYEDDETGEDLKYVSDLLLSYGLSVSDFDGFSMRLNFTHTGEQDVDDYETGGYPTPVVEKDKYAVASLTMEKRILDFNEYGDLALRGEIHNLLDRDYSYVKGYPMPGRNFVVGLRYEY